MPEPSSSSSSPASRRAFFRRLMVGGLDRVEDAGRRLAHALPPIIGTNPPNPPSPGHPNPRPPRLASPDAVRYLRPPGALPEADFRDACTRCGDCLRACPAQCIVVQDTPEPSPPPEQVAPEQIALEQVVAARHPLAYPHIIARTSPCVVCEDLSCMKVCPTDALQLTASVMDIRMGLAEVDEDACLRSSGEDCRLCVTSCPLGEDAIAVVSGRVAVKPACIGCGVCERACPTEPASIIVKPAVPAA